MAFVDVYLSKVMFRNRRGIHRFKDYSLLLKHDYPYWGFVYLKIS